jgi:hypothetical protein
LEAASSVTPTQQFERSPFERMTAASNPHLVRVIIEMMMVVMGSVSSIPSTASSTIC